MNSALGIVVAPKALVSSFAASNVATAEVQDHIFRNMSNTTANMLKEDLQFIAPLSLSEVHEVQSFILRTLFNLEKKWHIKNQFLTTITNNQQKKRQAL